MDIYVGNLSYEVTDAELQAHFEKFGKVSSARVVIDRATGRSKGFGFVEIPDRSEAEKAIAGTNGADFMGRPLRVNESQPKPREDRRGGGGGGFGGGGRREGGFGGGGRREGGFGGGGKRW
jgi:RNA recognition motif-containing protein